ncbi:MAG: Hpt domain-containing protein [Treponema sp.]|nr:Hpt domain-containing protein [Treponema sp.]
MHRDGERDPDPVHLDFDDLRAEYGDKDFIAEILGVFVVDCPAAMGRLEGAVAAGDAAEAGRAAHSLLNILGVLRCAPALRLVEEIVAALRSGDPPSLPAPVARLRAAVDALVEEGRQYRCS